jgi:hypothetical protein
MNNTPPEVLIYIQTVRNYLKNDSEARDYFIGNSDEELFYTHLTEISNKNFIDSGETMLNKEQFELLRKTISAISISKKEISDPYEKIFQDTEKFGRICLN